MATLCAKRTSAPRADEVLKLKSATEKICAQDLAAGLLDTSIELFYWALADVTREAPRLGPSTTTIAPIFTRL